MKKDQAVKETTANPFADMNNGTDAIPEDAGVDDVSGINFDTDFDIDAEYKPVPLCPKGNYTGSVTGVSWDAEAAALIWEVVTDNSNEGLMSDGETTIAGQSFTCRNWFPKAGDENERSKSGRMSKRQAKINMIKDFAEKMKVDMNSPKAIIAAVQNSDWIGIPVIISINIEVYQGRSRNSISKMVRMAD